MKMGNASNPYENGEYQTRQFSQIPPGAAGCDKPGDLKDWTIVMHDHKSELVLLLL